MDIKALGPLEAYENGIMVVPTANKPRQVLALLALNAPGVVTVSALMEEIWGDTIPRTATTTLQTYILRLRNRIGNALGCGTPRGAEGEPRGAKDVLATRNGGYQLDIQPGTCDVDDFIRLTTAGKAAYDVGDVARAATLLDDALALWRGPALVDVMVGRILELEVLRLEEIRMATLERRIAAELQLGRHAKLVPELRVLVSQHPLHEGFCAQLMVALACSDSSWRALEAFHRLRQALVEQLGLEPSPRLQRLHLAVLSGDSVHPRLAAAA